MNLFGAFNFGRLIKTFLPGYLHMMGAYLFADSIVYLLFHRYCLSELIEKNIVLVTVFSIPCSLIFGIISNMVFFAYFTDKIIRIPYAKENQKFLDLENQFCEIVVESYNKTNLIPSDIYIKFKEFMDLDYFLLPKVPLDKLIFLQESYWYYLEFQLNIILALIVLVVSVTFWVTTKIISDNIHMLHYSIILLMYIAITIFFIMISLKAARINYDKHKKKMISLYVSVFLAEHRDN